MNTTELFERLAALQVLVVGDVMIDSYLWGKVERISPEAPVPVVNVQRTEQRLGGAANVARNIRALGATPRLCAVVGSDKEGDTLRQLLAEEGMPTAGILSVSDRPTTIKRRILSGSQQLLRVDAETTRPISESDSQRLLRHIQEVGREADVLIFEDYDKGVLSPALIQEIISWAKTQGIPTVVDPKKRNFWAYNGCTLFKPNLKELKEGMQTDFVLTTAHLDELIAAARRLRDTLDAEHLLVTLSELGVLALSQTATHHVPAHKREISDVSGAGDTVVSVAAMLLALGLPLREVAALSNLAGGLVCEYLGVVPIPKSRFAEEVEKVASGF